MKPSDTWKSYERAAERGPSSIAFKVFLLIAGLLLLGTCIFVPVGLATGWFGEAAAVVRDEFGPRELLRKYEWFKDASAALDAKIATLQRLERRPRAMEADYADTPRKDWARDDRQQHSIWMSEIEGVAASFNTLAAEYNAQMAKFNYRFTNAGDLPQGAAQPLPREYKPYLY